MLLSLFQCLIIRCVYHELKVSRPDKTELAHHTTADCSVMHLTRTHVVINVLLICRFLRVIIVSSFRESAAGQKHVVGIHNDLAVLFKEQSQRLAGAPSNALLAGLFQKAAPRKMKTNVWARLRGQQETLTIKVRFP